MPWLSAPTPDRPVGCSCEAVEVSGVEAEEALVEALLRLAAEAVVQAGEHDDQPVAGVGRLADERRVVGRLAGLDLADDHAPAVPRPVALGVLEPSEDLVRDPVLLVDRRRRAIAVREPLPVGALEPPLDLAAARDRASRRGRRRCPRGTSPSPTKDVDVRLELRDELVRSTGARDAVSAMNAAARAAACSMSGHRSWRCSPCVEDHERVLQGQREHAPCRVLSRRRHRPSSSANAASHSGWWSNGSVRARSRTRPGSTPSATRRRCSRAASSRPRSAPSNGQRRWACRGAPGPPSRCRLERDVLLHEIEQPLESRSRAVRVLERAADDRMVFRSTDVLDRSSGQSLCSRRSDRSRSRGARSSCRDTVGLRSAPTRGLRDSSELVRSGRGSGLWPSARRSASQVHGVVEVNPDRASL